MSTEKGSNLFKEVLWVSVGQRAAELPAVKAVSQKRILPLSAVLIPSPTPGRMTEFFFKAPTLMAVLIHLVLEPLLLLPELSPFRTVRVSGLFPFGHFTL